MRELVPEHHVPPIDSMSNGADKGQTATEAGDTP